MSQRVPPRLDLSLLQSMDKRELINRLGEFREPKELTSDAIKPLLITRFLDRIAKDRLTDFHSFFAQANLNNLTDPDNSKRIALIENEKKWEKRLNQIKKEHWTDYHNQELKKRADVYSKTEEEIINRAERRAKTLLRTLPLAANTSSNGIKNVGNNSAEYDESNKEVRNPNCSANNYNEKCFC
jgi:hypothetical protein